MKLLFHYMSHKWVEEGNIVLSDGQGSWQSSTASV